MLKWSLPWAISMMVITCFRAFSLGSDLQVQVEASTSTGGLNWGRKKFSSCLVSPAHGPVHSGQYRQVKLLSIFWSMTFSNLYYFSNVAKCLIYLLSQGTFPKHASWFWVWRTRIREVVFLCFQSLFLIIFFLSLQNSLALPILVNLNFLIFLEIKKILLY